MVPPPGVLSVSTRNDILDKSAICSSAYTFLGDFGFPENSINRVTTAILAF